MKKEEQKKHLIDMMKDDENLGLYKEEKQETTLEEAAEEYEYTDGIYGFKAGAKWKEERMYSEEDMEEAFENGLKRSFDSDFDRWFEQFKQETLEEATERIYGLADKYSKNRTGFIQGAKWKEERMYSEEEVLAMLLIKHNGLTPQYVLEQFKKK